MRKRTKSKNKWKVLKKVAFKTIDNKTGDTETFLLTKRVKQKYRFRFPAFIFFTKQYSIKDIAIKIGKRKVGTVGTSTKTKNRRVRCPYCKHIQRLKSDYQTCEECKNRFYLHDDNW